MKTCLEQRGRLQRALQLGFKHTSARYKLIIMIIINISLSLYRYIYICISLSLYIHIYIYMYRCIYNCWYPTSKQRSKLQRLLCAHPSNASCNAPLWELDLYTSRTVNYYVVLYVAGANTVPYQSRAGSEESVAGLAGSSLRHAGLRGSSFFVCVCFIVVFVAYFLLYFFRLVIVCVCVLCCLYD